MVKARSRKAGNRRQKLFLLEIMNEEQKTTNVDLFSLLDDQIESQFVKIESQIDRKVE